MKRDSASYRVKTLRKKAEIFLVGGKRLEGAFFLSPISANQRREETILELLCGDRAYLPFETTQGKIVLIQKTNIIKVISKEPAPYPDGAKASGQIKVWFDDGSFLNGEVLFSMPTTHSRISDFLNHSAEFFYVHKEGIVYVVNRDHITFVEPINETYK